MKNHKWTEEDREVVRRDYQHTMASAGEIATRLGVTFSAVRGQIASMGIAKRSDHQHWTPKEKERLRELIGEYCVRRIARILHRSINSVVVMAKRLGCSRRARDGWFTKMEVCEILGMGHRWVQRRIDSGALKATYHHESRPSQQGSVSWHIEEKDLKEFIRKYPQELNGRNIDLVMIVDILVGLLV